MKITYYLTRNKVFGRFLKILKFVLKLALLILDLLKKLKEL